jgi:hypothetical protein
MAAVLCPLHGLRGVNMVCVHIVDALAASSSIPYSVVEVGDILVPKVNLCDACLEQWKIIDVGLKEDFLDLIQPVCGSCFALFS